MLLCVIIGENVIQQRGDNVVKSSNYISSAVMNLAADVVKALGIGATTYGLGVQRTVEGLGHLLFYPLFIRLMGSTFVSLIAYLVYHTLPQLSRGF